MLYETKYISNGCPVVKEFAEKGHIAANASNSGDMKALLSEEMLKYIKAFEIDITKIDCFDDYADLFKFLSNDDLHSIDFSMYGNRMIPQDSHKLVIYNVMDITDTLGGKFFPQPKYFRNDYKDCK